MTFEIGDRVTIAMYGMGISKTLVGRAATVVGIRRVKLDVKLLNDDRVVVADSSQVRIGWPPDASYPKGGTFCAHCIDAEHGLEQRPWRGKKVWLCLECREGRLARDISLGTYGAPMNTGRHYH